MEPNNPANNPETNQTPSENPNMGMPQPLNTSAQAPTVMPMGEPTPPPPPPQSGGLPQELPNSLQVSKASGKSGMFIMMSIIVVILIILGIGGYYFYTNMGQAGNKQTPQTPQNTQELTGLATELEGVELADPEGDLKEIDREITLLEATPSSR